MFFPRSILVSCLILLLIGHPYLLSAGSASTISTSALSSTSTTTTGTSTTRTTSPSVPNKISPLSTPRFRKNGTWSREYALPGTPPNHWWLIDYWNNWNYYGSFTAVANSITGLSLDDDVLILPLNLAYGNSSNWQWFQFDIDFNGGGLGWPNNIWWGIWNVDSPGTSEDNYHPHTIGLTYTIGHAYHYEGSLVGGNFRFQIWDDSAGTTWSMDFSIPSTSQFYDSSAFSPASALEGYTTPPAVGNAPYYQFTIGYEMTSFTFLQAGSGLPSGLAVDQQNLGGSPISWHWEMTSGARDFEIYSLPMSYLGEDPESVKENDLHAEIRVNYIYQGQSRSITASTYFDVTADVGSQISFTVTSVPSGWSFGNKWDHYGYAQHDITILTITVVSGPDIDRVAAFFNSVPIQITVASNPTGSGFVTVDGFPIITPQVFSWIFNSSHTITANPPVSGGTGVQYVWVSWSDAGNQSHSITVPSSPTTYTANFKKQYLLTVSASPTGGGIFSVNTGWQDDGTTASVTATANTNYSFYYWTLDAVNMGSNPTILVSMNSPHTLTAYFRGTSSISVALSSPSIALGSPVTLSGTVTPNQPSPGISAGNTVVLSYSLDGASWNVFIVTQTGVDGAYSVVWYSPHPGNYQIKAAWNGNSDYQGSTSSTVTLAVTGTLPPRITLLISGPSSVAISGSATFDVLADNPGSPMSTTLYFEVSGPGGYRHSDTQQVTMGAGRGRYQFVWLVPSTASLGQYQVSVSLIPPKSTAITQTQVTVA